MKNLDGIMNHVTDSLQGMKMISYDQSSSTIQRGFTLVELVVVIILIGIIGAVAAPKFLENTSFQNRSAADQVKSALQYGQKVAIAQRHQVGVAVNSAASTNCDATVVSYAVTCSIVNTVSLSISKTFYFDGLGEPVSAAGVPNSAQDSITVGDPTDGGATILIEQGTGYVH